jgi:hypothetical protein
MMFGHFIRSEVAGMSANTDKISTNTLNQKYHLSTDTYEVGKNYEINIKYVLESLEPALSNGISSFI